jgi:UDP-glucose 4-epimerase
MTRFLMSLEESVDTILAALADGAPGETYIPRVPSARVVDIADALIGDRPIQRVVTGIRPGEKVHEILVSEEESHRTVARNGFYVILPLLPELRASHPDSRTLEREYGSGDDLMSKDEVARFLAGHGLLPDRELVLEEELLA